MHIALEGIDGVGKTTLAKILRSQGHDVDDRTWVTNWVYRLAMPDHDWSDKPHQLPNSQPDCHLVVIDPGDSTGYGRDSTGYGRDYQAEAAHHGYTIEELGRARFGYLSMATLLKTDRACKGMLFASVTVLSWRGGRLILERSTDYREAAAQLVIAAAALVTTIKCNNHAKGGGYATDSMI